MIELPVIKSGKSANGQFWALVNKTEGALVKKAFLQTTKLLKEKDTIEISVADEKCIKWSL